MFSTEQNLLYTKAENGVELLLEFLKENLDIHSTTHYNVASLWTNAILFKSTPVANV